MDPTKDFDKNSPFQKIDVSVFFVAGPKGLFAKTAPAEGDQFLVTST